LKLRKEAASGGVPNALYNVGCMYLSGEFVAQNYSKAFLLFQQAALKGHAMAIVNLAVMHLKGYGVAKNESIAREWLKKVAPFDLHARELLQSLEK